MNRLASTLRQLLDPAADFPTTRSTTAHTSPTIPSPSGIYLGRGTRGPVCAGPEHHALILGPPRSGKTSRLVVPAVSHHPGPAVVTSTKSDILRSTFETRSRLGRCWYWDPSGTTVVPAGAMAMTWSPVTGCEQWDEAISRAHSLAAAGRPARANHDAHWIERAEALLAPLLHAAALAGSELAAVLSWLHRRELTDPASILDSFDSRRAADILAGLVQTDGRELSGIFSTADGILAAYRTDAALAATRSPNFDPAEFSASADTVYLVSPASHQAVHAAIVVALLDQIRAAVYRWKPNPPMLYALDEVANIAPLPELPAVLAEGGSQGLVVVACLQDLSQARARWDRAADGFLTLFTHKVVLPGIGDTVTLRAIRILAGDTDIAVQSVNATDTLIPKSSTTWSTQRRPRLPEDRIAHGQSGTAILISGAHIQQIAV